jgi:hypothetical protein
MEKEILDKLGTQITLDSIMTSKKNQTKHFNESSIWKYLDYTNWIPGEIEVEEEIVKDFDR